MIGKILFSIEGRGMEGNNSLHAKYITHLVIIVIY